MREYAGAWELPVIGDVAAPTAVLIRPDGHVAWVGDGTDAGPPERARYVVRTADAVTAKRRPLLLGFWERGSLGHANSSQVQAEP